MPLCCCGTGDVAEERKEKKGPPTTDEILKQQLDNENLGCYLMCEEGELWAQWNMDPPDGIALVFAKPKTLVAPGVLTKPARLMATITDNLSFFTGIINYIRDVAVYKPKLNVYADADQNAYIPFIMATHQPGNGIIGDRVVKATAGGGEWIDIDAIDGVAAVPLVCTLFNRRTMTSADFIQGALDAGGVSLKLDASGKVPPKVMYSVQK